MQKKEIFLSFCSCPILSRVDIDREFHFSRENPLHNLSDFCLEYFLFSLVYLKDEFIMDLEDHPGFAIVFADVGVELDHREFYDIGGCPLYRHIDSFPFSSTPDHLITIPDSRHISSASEKCLHIPVFVCSIDDIFIVFTNPRIHRIEFFDILRRFAGRGIDHLGETEPGYPVYYAKVDRLRDPTKLRGNGRIFSEEKPCCASMNIFSSSKGIDEGRIARQAREDSELHLRIIRHEELVFRGIGSETRFDLIWMSFSGWDILEIRIL